MVSRLEFAIAQKQISKKKEEEDALDNICIRVTGKIMGVNT
jgi:hypothetical protein